MESPQSCPPEFESGGALLKRGQGVGGKSIFKPTTTMSTSPQDASTNDQSPAMESVLLTDR